MDIVTLNEFILYVRRKIEIVKLVNEVIVEVKNRDISVDELIDLINESGKDYLEQFTGEMRGANALNLGAFLSGDMELDRFADLSLEMIKVANSKGVKARNYFDILLEKVKNFNRK